MNEKEVRERAIAMLLTSPAYPPGPYRFVNREFFIIAYRTDPDALRAVIPAPLEFTDPIVKYEFIRMPDSTGFGDYTESGQVIPVSFRGEKGGYVHSMYLDCDPPIAGGRELWGFPEEAGLAHAQGREGHPGRCAALRPGAGGRGHHGLQAQGDRHRRGARVGGGAGLPAQDHPACGRHAAHLRTRALPVRRRHACTAPGSGPAALELFHHALAPVASLPVLEVLSATHIICDLTLNLGTVVHDYLANK